MGESERPKVDPPADCPSWLESLFDLSPDLMCLAAVDGYFKRVNPAFERTLGYTVEEFVSRPMIDFVHPEDRGDAHCAALEALAGGEELRQFENRCICRDGSVRWLQWNCRPETQSRTVSSLRPRGTSPTACGAWSRRRCGRWRPWWRRAPPRVMCSPRWPPR